VSCRAVLTLISVYLKYDHKTYLIRPSPVSGSRWVFRIGRIRNIRSSCELGLIPSHLAVVASSLSISVMRSRTDSQRVHRHFR
jgi:hypothetical protein